jgi:hypothetical protein
MSEPTENLETIETTKLESLKIVENHRDNTEKEKPGSSEELSNGTTSNKSLDKNAAKTIISAIPKKK